MKLVNFLFSQSRKNVYLRSNLKKSHLSPIRSTSQENIFSWRHETDPWFKCNVFLVGSHLVQDAAILPLNATEHERGLVAIVAQSVAISWAARNPTQGDDSRLPSTINHQQLQETASITAALRITMHPWFLLTFKCIEQNSTQSKYSLSTILFFCHLAENEFIELWELFIKTLFSLNLLPTVCFPQLC